MKEILEHKVNCKDCRYYFGAYPGITIFAIRHGYWGQEATEAEIEALESIKKNHLGEYPDHRVTIYVRERT